METEKEIINEQIREEELTEANDAAEKNNAENSETAEQESASENKQEQRVVAEKVLSPRKLKKLEKLERKKKIREIRNILLGNMVVLSDGRITAGSGCWITRNGFGDGAFSTIVFGVKEKKYYYSTGLKNATQAVYRATEAMSNIGRELYLDCAPKSRVCYVKSILFKPVVLVFENVKNADGSDKLELRTYCGRSPFAFFSVMRAVARFNKALPDEIVRAGR